MQGSDPIEEALKELNKELERQALHFAAGAGNIAAIEDFISRGYEINLVDDLGLTPLHYAVGKGRIEAAKLLLEKGAFVDAIDENKIQSTPLCKYAGTCSLEMARLLIEHGADPSIHFGLTPSAIRKAEERKRGDGPKILKLFMEAVENQGTYRLVKRPKKEKKRRQ